MNDKPQSRAGASDPGERLASCRSQVMRMPGYALLNAGSYSPLPRPVFERTSELRRQLAENPNRFIWRAMPDLLDAAREALKSELSCKTGVLTLMPNTTYAINMVLRSLIVHSSRPQKIVTTNLEYGALSMALRLCAERVGASIQTVVVPPAATSFQVVLDAFEQQVPDTFDFLYLSHVTSPTGMVFPLASLAKWAKGRGARVIVDGAHAPGLIDVHLDHLAAAGVDYYAGNVHKWLMGPTGSAFLYQGDGQRDELQPLITSWGAIYDRAHGDEKSGWSGTFRERALEYQGTQDRVAQMAITSALEFRHQVPRRAAEDRIDQLAGYCVAKLSQLGLKPLLPHANDPAGAGPMRRAMLAFPFARLRADQAMGWLGTEHQVEVAFTGLPTGESYLRVSTAWFSTEEDIDRLAKALSLLPLDALRLS